jgi:WD40 repeat protein
MSPDGKIMAAVELAPDNYPQSVMLRNAASGQKIKALHHPHLEAFRYPNDVDVEFSPDSRKLSVVWEPSFKRREAPGVVQLWDLPTGNLIATLQDKDKDLQGPVPIVRFTADSKLLTLRGGYILNKLKVRDASTGKLIRTLKGKQGDFTSVDLSPDGQMAAAGGEDGIVRLWRIR